MNFLQNSGESILKNISNIPGWSTKRKLVVFLVDDWGSIRIPNKTAYDALLKAGVDCESNRFNKYDTLESPDDLSLLFETLSSIKDKNGNPPSFTSLTTVANPDFDKIRESDYRKYYYEPFTSTLETYHGFEKVFALLKQGVDAGIFNPQFHGREHLNVDLWLKGLQNGDHNLLAAFDHRSIGVPMSGSTQYKSSYMAAFDFETANETEKLAEICHEGLLLFKQIFGYQASLFTSSSLLHNKRLEFPLLNDGIKFIDRAKSTFEPLGGGHYRKRLFWLGQKNDFGQSYITRNCMFEPNLNPSGDCVSDTLRDISIAFRWNKPAIISSHRVNFVGSVSPSNRDHGLKSLKTLLSKIKLNWPEIEFLKFKEFTQLFAN